MDTQNRLPMQIAAGVLALGIVILALATLPAYARRWIGAAWEAPSRPVQSKADSLNGTYLGTVKLDWAMPGEYSDPLPTPTPDPEGTSPPDLGEIDLGLALVQASSTVSGYVDLEFSLVFTGEHTVDGQVFGPYVEGTFDGTNLALESERVSLQTAGQRLMRQFRLTGERSPDQENVLSGEYRETVWGYGPQPLTIIGAFNLRLGKLPESGLRVIKSVDTGGLSEIPLGNVVTYTLVISNSDGTVANSVVVTDILPSGVSFGDQFQGSTPLPLPDNVYEWGPYDIAAHATYTIAFTAGVTIAADFAGRDVTNIVYVADDYAGSDSDSASFTIAGGGVDVYLPLVLRNQ
jgi:uncharacterized repeat protein (TIGR01451 family)